MCWAPLSLPLAVRSALTLTSPLVLCILQEVSFYGDGTLLQAVRILRTTLANGHLMFSDTLLLKITMDILFVDALASRG